MQEVNGHLSAMLPGVDVRALPIRDERFVQSFSVIAVRAESVRAPDRLRLVQEEIDLLGPDGNNGLIGDVDLRIETPQPDHCSSRIKPYFLLCVAWTTVAAI